jgi:5-methylcytosine-specific restriction endonuclease McrA
VARTPCRSCDTTDALLVIRGNQAVVRCAQCHRHLYNAPKTETGARRRTVKTLRTTIRPAQQARILNRDRGRCILCGSTEELTIGHLLSIEDGARLGATEFELNSDANLAAMCEACNLGLLHSAKSVTPRTFAVLVWRLVQAELTRSELSTGQLELPIGRSGVHPDHRPL